MNEPEADTPLAPVEMAEADIRAAMPEPADVPSGLPSVSLERLVAAATGGRRYPAGVKVVQAALASRRFLPSDAPTTGVFDSGTLSGYRALQLHLGFTSTTAGGLPDKHSLTWLALRTGLYRMETD